MERSTARLLSLLFAAVFLPILLAACTNAATTDKSSPRDERGRIVLTMAYSPEKAQLVEKLVGEFNKQSQAYSVKATKLEMADMLTCLLYTSDAADDLLCVDL